MLVGSDLFSEAQQASSAGDETGGVVEQHLRGEVLRIRFASDDGSHVVLTLSDESYREHTLVGPMTGTLEGQDVEAWGYWETHKQHGRQFRVTRFRPVLPRTEDGIRRYLASGIVPGIGPKMAERIVERFGTETIDVLDNYSARLKDVPGVGKKRIEQIREAWKSFSEQRDVFVYLQGIGLGASHCARLFRKYGAGAADMVRRNPYRLASEVHGIGFTTADRIAGQLGIDKKNPQRLAAGIAFTLERLADRGHCCFPINPLLAEAARLLEVEVDDAGVGLQHAVMDGLAVRDAEGCPSGDEFVYRREMYEVETELAECLQFLLRTSQEGVAVTCGGAGFEQLDDAQQYAVRAAFDARLSIITGGPGVGKTTVVAQIVEHARRAGMFVELAAPTGRAAKRLTETSGIPAKTVHRLLQWDAPSASFVHGRDKPIRCDMLIVDEVSMLDAMLANCLFAAVAPGTHVVLVGDRDQLPSVGPGAVLHDLIASERVPVTHLTRIYRQAEGSRIVRNAHSVNMGRMPDLRPVPRDVLGDFYWIEQEDPERVAGIIERMVTERIPARFGVDPIRDVQILAPMNKGTCGAMSLNNMLQSTVNAGDKPEFQVGERTYRVGDRVMQIVNNYDKGVFNGDLGRIAYVDRTEKTFRIEFDDGLVDYDWADSDQVRLAYAVTVHKSQGCEFPVVIMPLLTQHYVMLQRNLLYTGMTRAKRLLVLVGSRRALGIAIHNDRPTLRHTRLVHRLREA